MSSFVAGIGINFDKLEMRFKRFGTAIWEGVEEVINPRISLPGLGGQSEVEILPCLMEIQYYSVYPLPFASKC
jgi:hypothetical protein